jgi:zinc transporter ZupT
MEFWKYILLFGTAFLAGLSAFLFKEVPRATLKTILSFSGAYILGITVLHLLPDVFMSQQAMMGQWILAGFFIQLLLEQLSKGIEHGHIHPTHSPNVGFAMQVMAGLCLHSFLEGIPLGAYPDTHLSEIGTHSGHGHFFWAIILHELPASFTLAALLLLSNFRKAFVLICLIIKCSMAPLGAFLSQSLAFDPQLSTIATAIVIGLFLHIATTILFEADSNQHHKIEWDRLLAIALGAGLALISSSF